ncbi:uncharacterized protein LOC129290755 [Prosopis cineraria]|uniref:uncharacterized protein LOC129290755 n=1 Tax=Prosopis cineraria TaxID=364024 RepID=UPI00240FE3E9|nr:uncharacterized protein LOC129290755 [Prosopis cineraria]
MPHFARGWYSAKEIYFLMADPMLVIDLTEKAWKIIQMGLEHKSTLENLKSTMKELVPVVEQIEESSEKITDIDAEEIAKLTAMMEATKEVICKCSQVGWWNCCLLPYYKNKLDEADKSLVKYISVQLQMQMARDLRIIRLKLTSDDIRLAETIHDHEISGRNSATHLSLEAASSSELPNKYDVFISFRGEDTRTNLASYIYAALCGAGVKAYGDYRIEEREEVRPSHERVIEASTMLIWEGEKLQPSHEQAVENSALFLVIFSKNYASSTSCLNELTKILESKDPLVLPVFYKVEPTHVQNQTGSYQVAFTKHERKYEAHKVQKWRAALTQAASFPGWNCAANRSLADLIQGIIKVVQEKLHKN